MCSERHEKAPRGLEKVVGVKGRKFLFKVEMSGFPAEYRKYEELRNEIWEFPEDHLPGTRNMMCENFFYDGSSLFLAVFGESEGGGFSRQDREHLVGFSYGFVGVKDKAVGFRTLENLQFYSQYTGVKPGLQGAGLGILIKEFQKEKLMELFGIYTITCTFEPLTGVNAYRNIHYFGMEVVDYRVDIYLDFGGRLNRLDVPSDRFVMSWDLREEARRPDYHLESILERGEVVNRVEEAAIQGKKGPVEVQMICDINLNRDPEFFLIEIPLDFYRMLDETDVEEKRVRAIPLEWRLKTREVFQTLLARDYKVIDFRQVERGNRKKNFYVLKK